MIYILNSNIKENKALLNALTSLTGVGKALSLQACEQLGISPTTILRELSNSQINQLNELMTQSYLTGSELRAAVRENKRRLRFISTYRGLRHAEGLPSRGQRTHGNARTARKLNDSALLRRKNKR